MEVVLKSQRVMKMSLRDGMIFGFLSLKSVLHYHQKNAVHYLSAIIEFIVDELSSSRYCSYFSSYRSCN